MALTENHLYEWVQSLGKRRHYKGKICDCGNDIWVDLGDVQCCSFCKVMINGKSN